MAKVIKYTGAQDPWPELAITGKQSVWHKGQVERRGHTEATLLYGTGFFAYVDQGPAPGMTRTAAVKTLPRAGSSSAANSATNGTLFNMQLPAPKGQKFNGVYLVYENYGPTPIVVDGVYVSSSPTHLSPANNALTFNQLFEAGAAGFTVPASPGSVGGTIRPGVKIVGPVRIKGVDRTDVVGAPQLLRVVTHVAPSTDASVVPSFNGTNYKALNDLADNQGMKVGSYQTTTVTLANITNNIVDCQEAGGYQFPISAIFLVDDPMDIHWAFGDSLTQGTGSSSGYAGWPEYATWRSTGTARPLTVSNIGTFGITTTAMLFYARDMLVPGSYVPKYASIAGGSPNDGFSQSAFDTAKYNVLAFCDLCRKADVIPVVRTVPNYETVRTNGTQALLDAHNAWIRSLEGDFMVVDYAAVINDPLIPGKVRPEYDNGNGTPHYPDVGYIKLADTYIARFS